MTDIGDPNEITANLIKIAKTMEQYAKHIGEKDDTEYNKLEKTQDDIWTVHGDLDDITSTIMDCENAIDDNSQASCKLGLKLLDIAETIHNCEKDLTELEKKGLHSKLLTNKKTPQEISDLRTGLLEIAATIVLCEKDPKEFNYFAAIQLSKLEQEHTVPHVVYPMRF